jgi:ribose-phosphate pyrophosphokinase
MRVTVFLEANKMDNNAIVYALSANKKMAIDIVKQLGLKMGESEVIHFADGETIVENNTTVRGKNVYVIQSTCPPVTERLFELLIFIDGLRRASAKEINVIIPYFGYARQDRKVRPREPITARLGSGYATKCWGKSHYRYRSTYSSNSRLFYLSHR